MFFLLYLKEGTILIFFLANLSLLSSRLFFLVSRAIKLKASELIDLMKKNNFYRKEFRNLSGGIVAIHSGWKI